MTALDQAFIKAYTRQDVVAPSETSETVPGVSLDDARLDLVFEEATRAASGQMAEGVSDAPAARPINAVAEELPARQPDALEGDSAAPDMPTTSSQVALSATAPPKGPFSERRVDAAHELASPDAPTESEKGSPVMAQTVAGSDPLRAFLPLLQVEHFLWPEECGRTRRRAPDQLKLLTDGLLDQAARGRKVVGLGGHAVGDGCTTILLSVARSLAESGRRAIIVDADLGNPCLSERLGIACQIGWDDALAAGEPLEEVVIESERDHLSLLPLRRPSSDKNDRSGRPGNLAAVLRRLRDNYDLVLVDLGRLDVDILTGQRLGSPIKECIDAVVVIHDVRNKGPAELDQVRHLLRQAEVVGLGVIENFV